MDEYYLYVEAVEEIENRIEDDTKYPVIKDNKIKICCKYTLETIKLIIEYAKCNRYVKKVN